MAVDRVVVRGDSIFVTLDKAQLLLATKVGAQRDAASARRRPRFAYRGGEDTSINRHIQGAQGEIAFCHAFGHVWNRGVNTFKAADVAGLWEVRYSLSSMWKVTPEDLDTRRVACIRGVTPTFEIVGWILARVAKRTIPLSDPGDRNRPAHFLSIEDLNLFDLRRFR